MRRFVTIGTVIFLLAAPHVAAWEHANLRADQLFLFDQSAPTLPAKSSFAVPISRTIWGDSDSPLTLGGFLYFPYLGPDDPRINTGRVILKIKVIRDGKVLWKRKLRDRVTSDFETTLFCGNCTHNLWACGGFEDSLEPGDVVLFDFALKQMPQFSQNEFAMIGVDIDVPEHWGQSTCD